MGYNIIKTAVRLFSLHEKTWTTQIEDVMYLMDKLNDILSANIPGDVIEIGCYRGRTSLNIKSLCDYHNNRPFHVYDNFLSLSGELGINENGKIERTALVRKKAITQEMFNKYKNLYRRIDVEIVDFEKLENYKMFKYFFVKAGLELPIVHFGDILLQRDFPEKICFAFIDCNFYNETLSSLRNIYPKMSKGGIIFIHDYKDSELFFGVERACNEFIKDKPEKIMYNFPKIGEIIKL